MVRPLATLHRLTRLRNSPDRSVLMEAALLLPTVAGGLRLLGFARLQGYLRLDRTGPGRQALEEARHYAALVDRAAHHTPLSYNCLHRSLTLAKLLRRRGLGADIIRGVRKTAAGDLLFHAWVEHGGEVLNDLADVRERHRVFEAREHREMESNGG